MAFESQSGIGIRHTTTIINDLNDRTTCINDQDIYRLRTGIDSILDQLFDDACRTLDNLTSRNLVGDGIR